MHLPTFGDSTSHASKPFELIHSDLKELPVLLYHHYKWFVTFLDDFTSYGWIVLLRKKSDTATAINDFLAMVRTQYNASVKTFMSNAGGELGNVTGYPGVFLGNPHLYPSKPVPASTGAGFAKTRGDITRQQVHLPILTGRIYHSYIFINLLFTMTRGKYPPCH